MSPTGETTLSCMVWLGMFSTERGVVVALPGGQVSALVDKRSASTLTRNSHPAARARVRVFVVRSE